LEDRHAADIAEGMQRLTVEETRSLLAQLEPDQAADVLIELPAETAKQVMSELPDSTLAHYLDILPQDDALDLRETLGEDRFDALLNVIPKEDANEIRRMLAYPEDSVGRVMTERFFEVTPDMTMQEILSDVRRSPIEKYEMVNDIYVLDENRYLQGIFSLRKAIRASAEMTAAQVMNDEPISCSASQPAEEAARQMARYGFYALPVLDDRHRMVGIFTGDDAQAIIREADTEDVLKLGAVGGSGDAYLSLSVIELFRRRIPWLLALFLAETLTGSVLRHYSKGGSEGLGLSPITFFIPLIIGAGGNTGSQVTTTITRALAVGEISPRDALLVMKREFVTALMVGSSLGVAGFIRAKLWGTPPDICFVVGLALPAIVIWAATVGSVLPLAAKRLGIDPAVMSAPFISTFVDATGLVIYFEIALRLTGHA
jgi:magnesium transporter